MLEILLVLIAFIVTFIIMISFFILVNRGKSEIRKNEKKKRKKKDINNEEEKNIFEKIALEEMNKVDESTIGTINKNENKN